MLCMKALLFITMLFSSIFAQDIDIKGLKIGMSFEDASKLFKITKFDNVYFAKLKNGKEATFASSEVKYIALRFTDNKITSIAVNLDSSDYSLFIAPLKDKYKSMKCESSIVQNKMGAKFNQEECFMTENDVRMHIEKYSDKITESYISVSKRPTKEELNKFNEKIKSDI